MFIANLHVAKHVDIDGFQEEAGQSPAHEAYMKTVLEARVLVRALEASTQAIYDDNAVLLSTAQELPSIHDEHFTMSNQACCARLDGLRIALDANASSVLQTLERLVLIGSNQAGLADGEYRQSISMRQSKIITIVDTLRPLVSSRISRGIDEDEVVGMEDAFQFSGQQSARRMTPFDDNYRAELDYSQNSPEVAPSTNWDQATQRTESIDGDGDTLAPGMEEVDHAEVDDEECKLQGCYDFSQPLLTRA
jgi:son of sevenless-like protein